MANNKYDFYAWIHAPKFERRIDIVSFGIWEEVSGNTFIPDDKLEKLKVQFKSMKRPSPMIFSWIPDNSNEKMLFQKLTPKDLLTVELKVILRASNNSTIASWKWSFYDVSVKRLQPIRKKVKVITTFSNFDVVNVVQNAAEN